MPPPQASRGRGIRLPRGWQHLFERGIAERIARRVIETNDRLGKCQCVVERTHAWLAAFDMLRIGFERSLEII